MKAVLVLIICLSVVHCSNMRKNPDEAITLELKGVPGSSYETRYYSNSRMMAYSEGQLLRDRTDAVDFTIRTDIKGYDPATKLLKFKVKTIRKDGKVPLHDLAFPELKQEIEYTVNGQTSTVLQAGSYDKQSLFFVPSIPMPKGPIHIGDTWTMQHTWHSANENIPLKLDVVGILKDVVTCNASERCADIEISGHVAILAVPNVDGASFSSKIWGRMLFSLERGDVLWSEMRSAENMIVERERVMNTSCMVSETKLGKEFRTKFECDPKEQPVAKIPSL